MARHKTADDVNDLQGMQDEDAGDAEAVRAFQGRVTDIVARAVAAEREACAKIAAEAALTWCGQHARSVAYQIREAIEARSNTSK